MLLFREAAAAAAFRRVLDEHAIKKKRLEEHKGQAIILRIITLM
jgi:hypothetical protein